MATVKERYSRLIDNSDLLSAFLLQSAYIESLLKRQFEFLFFFSIESNFKGVVENEFGGEFFNLIKNRVTQGDFKSLLNHSKNLKILSKSNFKKLDTYRQNRNKIVHDIIKEIDSDALINESLMMGNEILSIQNFQLMIQATEQSKEIVKNPFLLSYPPYSRVKTSTLTSQEIKFLTLRLRGKNLVDISHEMNVSISNLRSTEQACIEKFRKYQGRDLGYEPLAIEISIKKNKEWILENVPKLYGYKKKDILSGRRDAHLVLARGLISVLLREYIGLSYPKIAQLTNHDHTTVMHACNRIKDFLEGEQMKLKVLIIED
jgi:hypothetical protein